MSSIELKVPDEFVADAKPAEAQSVASTREVRHEYSLSLPPLLSQLGVSLLVSTYQAGKVVAVGVADGELTLSYHNFERAMGLAVKPDAHRRRRPRPDLVPASRPRTRRPRRARRPPRRLLPDPLLPLHRRDPGPRTGLGRR